jgi:hypothetical protein
VYFIHAGEDLSPQQMEAASDRVAEFLMLDSITPAGSFLEAARLEVSETPGLRLRSFGLYEFGFTHGELLDASVNRLCRALLQRLGGPSQAAEQKKPSRLLGGGTVEASPTINPLEELDHRSAALARTMGLEVEPLMQVVQQFALADLGGDPEAFFRKLMVGPPGTPAVVKWIDAASDVFGRQHSDTSIQAQVGELAQALDERIAPWIAQVGTGLREWIEAIVDDPQCRVSGARRAAKWFQNYLKGLVDKLGEARSRFVRECAQVSAALAATETSEKGKPQRRSPAEVATLFLQYCRLRLFELAAQRASQIAHALQSHAMAAHDGLVDLQRELDHLASQFPVDDAAAAGAPVAEVGALQSSVAQQLAQATDGLVKQLDEQLTQNLFATSGGMRSVFTSGGEVRQRLLTTIRTAARQAALATVQSIDLTSMLLNQGGESPLAKCVSQAQPWLQCCGGRRRLLFVLPQQIAHQFSPAALAAQLGTSTFGQQPGVSPGAAGDLALVFELGDVSVPHAAARLIDFRRDLADAAARLQTRSDIHWAPVFAF